MAYTNEFASKANDNNDNIPQGTPPPATNADNGAGTIERYTSVDDFRSEFGSYRVNAKVENLCESRDDYELDSVPFPPLKNQSPFNEQSETPEGY